MKNVIRKKGAKQILSVLTRVIDEESKLIDATYAFLLDMEKDTERLLLKFLDNHEFSDKEIERIESIDQEIAHSVKEAKNES